VLEYRHEVSIQNFDVQEDRFASRKRIRHPEVASGRYKRARPREVRRHSGFAVERRADSIVDNPEAPDCRERETCRRKALPLTL